MRRRETVSLLALPRPFAPMFPSLSSSRRGELHLLQGCEERVERGDAGVAQTHVGVELISGLRKRLSPGDVLRCGGGRHGTSSEESRKAVRD